MYYLNLGLTERGFPTLGKILGGAAAVFIIFGALGGGNMFQANQATSQLLSLFDGGGSRVLVGVIFAIAVASVILGGIKSIARVTSKVVPFMAGLYLCAGVIVLLVNITEIPVAFAQIFTSAFSPAAGLGGIIGVMFQGFKRAAFSNEAGVGSAAIAHSAVKTKEPLTEGLVALLGPFIDTVVICTMTALVIVVSGTYSLDLNGIAITSAAFATVLPWFPYVLTVVVVLFAFSTMLSWSYYGIKAWGYLFGTKHEAIFKVIFCLFVIVGASMNLGPVIDLSDAAIFLAAFVNIIGLYFLVPVIKKETESFFRRLKTGEIKRYD